MLINLLQVVRRQVHAKCEGKEPSRCDGLDLRDQARIKKRITDATIGGPDVEREYEFPRGPFVGRTSYSHDFQVGGTEREAL